MSWARYGTAEGNKAHQLKLFTSVDSAGGSELLFIFNVAAGMKVNMEFY